LAHYRPPSQTFVKAILACHLHASKTLSSGFALLKADCAGTIMVVRTTPHMLDPGVREPVELLNSIDGVATRASCEGQGTAPLDPHSVLAYVTFKYPLPPRFQEFLVTELGMLGRVDDDAIYCRWPPENRHFLELLGTAAKRYKQRNRGGRRRPLVASLSELQSHLLAFSAGGNETVITACRMCSRLVIGPHSCRGGVRILRWAPASTDSIFRDFVELPDNRLDAGLVAAVATDELQRRTDRGDFGAAFRRRWARYQRTRLRQEIIAALRAGVRQLRRAGKDLDVHFDAHHARVTWGQRRVRP
jgi:hypothetical protein